MRGLLSGEQAAEAVSFLALVTGPMPAAAKMKGISAIIADPAPSRHLPCEKLSCIFLDILPFVPANEAHAAERVRGSDSVMI